MAEAERADAVALGPGLGRTAEARALVGRLLERLELPVVVDADALFGLEPVARAHPTVLTPHAGELARLLDRDSAWVDAHRLEAAREGAERYGAVVLLKGAGSIVQSPDGGPVVCDTGPPSLATAGTGDVLTGVVAAFLAKGLDPVHGRSGGRHGPRARGCGRPSPGRARRGRRRRRAATGVVLSAASASGPRRGGGSLERVRVEILGSGGAATIPRPGCRCRVCVEAREKGGRFARTGPSTFVHGPNILFDTPEESKLQLERAGIGEIAACFYSHWHPDHTMGRRVWETRNGDFRTWPREAKRPLVTDVYLPEQVADDFRTWLGGMAHLEFMRDRGWIRIHELRDGETVEIGGVTVRPFRLAEDYVYAFELTEGGRRLLVAMDELNGWSPPPDGCEAATWPCCRWGSASSISSPVSA